MENKKEKILHGIPRAYYGAFGGITPFPICLKAVSDYLGDELDYTFAIVACGAAFRFAWDTTAWNAGNVDIYYAYGDPEKAYRNGVTALGREFKMLWRSGIEDNVYPQSGRKEEFKAFIKAQIDADKPVISLGPIGPAEAGIITGYRNGGDTLFGWSLFQWDEKTFNEDGYFTTDTWWDEGDFFGVMSLGDISAPRMGTKQILQNAVSALEGRQEGRYAKGTAAYDAWKKALLNAGEDDFALTCGGAHLVMMCQGDATDCLIDGRKNACKYFMDMAKENSEQPLYAQIAEQFGVVATVIHEKIYGVLGGWERGPEQIKKLEQPEVRRKISEYIDEMKAADEKALALMKELLGTIGEKNKWE